jgi:hypothetical protein
MIYTIFRPLSFEDEFFSIMFLIISHRASILLNREIDTPVA